MLERLPPSRVLYEWDAIGKAIGPAIKAGEPVSLDDVRIGLLSGRFEGWKVHDVGHAYAVTWRAFIVGTLTPALWVLFAGGRMFGGPKKRLWGMRELLMRFEGWKVHGVGDAYAVTWRAFIVGSQTPALWVLFAGGKMFGGPKKRLWGMRELLMRFEDEAKRRRYAEMRIEDRDWSLVAADYMKTTKPDGGILLRKVL